MQKLKDMQNDIYLNIKKGSEKLKEIGDLSSFVRKVAQLEEQVDNLEEIMKVSEINEIIGRLTTFEQNMDGRLFDKIKSRVNKTVRRNVKNYSKSNNYNTVFYSMLFLMVLGIGSIFMSKSLSKAEKEHDF